MRVSVCTVLVLLLIGGPVSAQDAHGHKSAVAPVAAETRVWTCAMHPQIRRNGPGKCPICGMDLIPVEQAGESGRRRFVTTEAARELMSIRVAPVERKFVTVEVRMVGKVDYDETKLGYITAWVPGRLDRLFVDYTGVAVRKGDHMVLLYSPQLLSAQAELFQAKRAIKELERSRIDIMKEDAQATLEAAREKLRLWGLSSEQVEQIEKSGKPSYHMQINAPLGGIVIEKNAQQGMYVDTGTRIYAIADLTGVWVKLDAYESDLVWLRYGQKVVFTTEAYPGNEFVGQVAFMDPVLDARTRTVKMRVNVPNGDGRLKPGMFVRGIVKAQVAAGGKVMDANLAGKWICYMHPEVVKDAAGTCDVCAMPLVTAGSLGYVPVAADDSMKPLVMPASAALITGKRAVVYVEIPGQEKPVFEGREVTLGPRAGDYYIVLDGLMEGELVVVEGNFKIDSSLQLQGKPSMMSPGGAGGAPTGAKPPAPAQRKLSAPDAFKQQLGGVWSAYRRLRSALAGDDLKAAAADVDAMRRALAAVDMGPLAGEAHTAWMEMQKSLGPPLDRMAAAKDIEELRKGFALLSEGLAAAIRAFGVLPTGPVFLLHCPMAFNNRGANWLSDTKDVSNPYFGAVMPKCGDVIETIIPAEDRASSPR